MKVYRTAKGWRIFIFIAAPLLLTLFSGMLIVPFFDDEFDYVMALILVPISLGMIAVLLYGLADVVKGKVIVRPSEISIINLFSTKQLKQEEIKGFRINDKYIIVEPKSQDKKKLKISTYLERTHEIISWLDSISQNLDLKDAEFEAQDILRNQSFGRNEIEREESLVRARKLTSILGWVAAGVGVWVGFWPKPYDVAIIACISVPAVAVIALRLSNGLIRFDKTNHSIYPSIIYAVLFPGCALFLRAMFDFNIFEYSNIWLPTTLLTLSLTAAVAVGVSEFDYKKAKSYLTVLSGAVMFCGYSYGAVVTTNCYFDNSQSKLYQASVISKRVSTGKTTSYYIHLTKWGGQLESDEVHVTKELYNSLTEGDEMVVFLKSGLWNVPWFTVTPKHLRK